jgi:hypothetical protein
MREKSKRCLGAIIPALLLCSPAFASSARSISRVRSKNLAVQSGTTFTGQSQDEAVKICDPFAVFGDSTEPVMVKTVASGQEVLNFLKNNDLLRANHETVSEISGEVDSVFGRKDFAHASAYNHCHFTWGIYNTHTYIGMTSAKCASWSGTWELGSTAPFFQTTSVGNKTATSFDVNVDLNQSSTVYAVLLLSTTTAPNSTQVRNGQDGNGNPAIQIKSLVVNSGAYTGTISFTGLTTGTKYMVYLVGQNGASELTPTPEVVNPDFVHGTLSSVDYWKFPKVRTDSHGDFYAMYANNGVIQFVKWNGNSWDNYASITSSSVSGRTWISYGNEYAANFEIDKDDNLHVIFNASPDQSTANYDGFLGVYNGTSWTFSQIADDTEAPGEVKLFVDNNNKDYVVYSIGYTLRYATDASGSWAARTIITAGTTGGTDELMDDYVVVDGTGKVSLIYRREDGQDSRQDDYYLTTSADNFASQNLILNGKDEAQQYQIGNVIVDASNKIHYVYYNMTNSTAYYRTDASGSWVTTTLSSPTYSITSSLGVAIDGTSTYILTNGTNGYHFQAKVGSGDWTYGNPFTLDGFFCDKIGLDTVSKRIMLMSENNSNWTVNYHGGEIGDYVTTPPPNNAPINTVVPAISGTSTVGSLLSATSGTWTDADGDTLTYTYQWYRADDNTGTNEAAISGATAGSYTLTVSDAHKYLRVVVTANDGHGSADQTATSTRTAAANSAPVNTVVPVISGTTTVGSLLSATSGTWTDADGDSPSYTYQWYRADDNSGTNETAISGATADNYTLTASDTHKYLRIVVTANDGHGSADQTATSTRTAVANAAPVNTVVPVISGTNTVGSTLSATTGTWTDSDGDSPTYSYQWYRADDNSGTNETAISGATAGSYTLTTSDAHKYLRVIVTANDGHGSADQTATSTRMALANVAPVNTVVPIISGTNKVGSTLAVTTGTWTDTDGDTPTFAYQWKADGTIIVGKTLPTCLLTAAQSKKTITCTITADDGNGGTPIITTDGVLVANSAPVFTGTPAITGRAKIKQTLSLADTGTSDADGDTVTLSYQWAAGGVDIPGATSETYLLTVNEDKKSITCTLTADDGNSGVTHYTTLGVIVKSGFPWCNLVPVLIAPKETP